MTNIDCPLSETETKFLELGELLVNIENLEQKACELGQSLADNIADGARTGDDFFDFLICTNSGKYDPAMPEHNYHELFEMLATEPGRDIMICQMAYFMHTDAKISLWSIYLATLREGEVIFRPDEEMMTIPVEPGYIKYQEVIEKNQFKFGWQIIDHDRLTVGGLEPLNNDTPFMAHRFRTEDIRYVPQKTPCTIQRHPYDRVEDEYGINPSLIDRLDKLWLRSRRKLTLVAG